MTVNGKTVILLILAVALGSATLAWWNQYRRGQRVLELWGPDVAYRIRLAPDTELLSLAASPAEPPPAPADANTALTPASLAVGSRVFAIEDRRNLTGSPGLVHARQALIQDSSYEWDAPTPDSEITWRYALQFRDPRATPSTTLLLIDPETGWVMESQRATAARLVPLIRQGLERLFRERLQATGASNGSPASASTAPATAQ